MNPILRRSNNNGCCNFNTNPDDFGGSLRPPLVTLPPLRQPHWPPLPNGAFRYTLCHSQKIDCSSSSFKPATCSWMSLVSHYSYGSGPSEAGRIRVIRVVHKAWPPKKTREVGCQPNPCKNGLPVRPIKVGLSGQASPCTVGCQFGPSGAGLSAHWFCFNIFLLGFISF